jgi:hypothetical protein
MADGTSKLIEEIGEGDEVLSPNAFSVDSPASVEVVYSPREVTEYLVLNGRLSVTLDQPLLSSGKWVEAGELRTGDLLSDVTGAAVPVTSIQRVDRSATVYNIKVSSGIYVAGGVVAHNKPFPYVIYSPDEPYQH